MTRLEEFVAQYPESTARTYLVALRQVERAIGKPLNEATQRDVLRWQTTIATEASATRARKMATLASFFGYLRLRGIRTDDPTVALRRPRVDAERSIRWLTGDQQLRLLEAAESDARATALVWVLAHGLRVSEAVTLDVESVQGDVLRRVRGKGDKSRDVPMEPEAVLAVRAYIGDRRGGPLFLSRKHGRLGQREVQRIIARLSRAAGSPIHPHALRHSAATGWIRAGVNLAIVQRLMGHASAATTQRYVHLDETALREAVRSAPLRLRAERQRLTVIEPPTAWSEAR